MRLLCAARLLVVLVLAGCASSCVISGLTAAHYFQASGGMDHEARVAAAWRGPAGELALALEDLEGVYTTEDVVLVLTAGELEQMFSGVPSTARAVLPVPHVPVPRSILQRGLTLPRPPPGSAELVPVVHWEVRQEVEGERRQVLPAPLEAPFTVHWTHHYRSGAAFETGFALLLTRQTPEGPRRALLLPEPAEPPWWPKAILAFAVVLDLTWMVLVLA